MKKKNAVVSLTAVAALLCVGGAFALNANTTVSADTAKQQIMLGASILVANEQTGLDSNGIRFPVVVADSVAEKITESKTYVLPAEFWTDAETPTATEIIAHAKTVASDTSDKWVNYYEENAGYGDDYQEAVVYMYNIPDDKYATDFYVCAWMQLNDTTEETSDVVCRSMQDVAVAAVESGAYSTEQLGKYLTETTYTVNHYLRTIYGNYVQTGEATTVESYIGMTATGDEVDGYTYNAKLTKEANDSLTVAADNATTVNCYYENDEYAFNKLYLSKAQGDATTITQEGVSIISEVADLAETDYRGNVIKYVAPGHVSTNVQTISFNSYWIGKYMVFNAYFTGTPTTGISDKYAGFVAYGNVNTTTPLRAKGIYNQEGKLYATSEITTANESGKWISFVHYIDPTYYGANGNDYFVITFANYHGCTAYLGEWLLVSEDEYQEYFGNDETSTTIALSSLSLTGANASKVTWAQDTTTFAGETVYKYNMTDTGAGHQDATLKFSYTPRFNDKNYYVVIEIYWDRSNTGNSDYYGTNAAVDQNRKAFTYYDMNGVTMTKKNKTWMQGVVQLKNSYTVHYLNLGYWTGGKGAEYVRNLKIIDQAEYEATFGTQA